jgi:hypothetical protein
MMAKAYSLIQASWDTAKRGKQEERVHCQTRNNADERPLYSPKKQKLPQEEKLKKKETKI